MGQQVLNPRPSALHACVLPFTTALASHKGSNVGGEGAKDLGGRPQSRIFGFIILLCRRPLWVGDY